MKLAIGNMWTARPIADLYLTTTNNYVRNDGTLVMGRGAALQAKQRWKGVEKTFGDLVEKEKRRQFATKECLNGVWVKYGVLISPYQVILEGWEIALGIFQVKHHWGDDATIPLIQHSVDRLCEIAGMEGMETVYMNYPGIGNGRLTEAEVGPVVEKLPDNVTLWKL